MSETRDFVDIADAALTEALPYEKLYRLIDDIYFGQTGPARDQAYTAVKRMLYDLMTYGSMSVQQIKAAQHPIASIDDYLNLPSPRPVPGRKGTGRGPYKKKKAKLTFDSVLNESCPNCDAARGELCVATRGNHLRKIGEHLTYFHPERTGGSRNMRQTG